MTLKKVLICPDVHIPYHDKKAWELFLRVIKRVRPDVFIFIGDIWDCYCMSDHDKDPTRYKQMQEETDIVNYELDRVAQLLPSKCKVFFCEGNHEYRLPRYLMKRAPALWNTLSVEKQLRIKERGWKFVPYRQHAKVGKLHFTHDVGRSGKYCTSQSLDAFCHNLVIGHSHRLQVIYSGNVKGEAYVGLNVGWLGDIEKIDYAHRSQAMKDWQLGFGLGYIEPNGWVHMQAVPILNGRCVVEGKMVK